MIRGLCARACLPYQLHCLVPIPATPDWPIMSFSHFLIDLIDIMESVSNRASLIGSFRHH